MTPTLRPRAPAAPRARPAAGLPACLPAATPERWSGAGQPPRDMFFVAAADRPAAAGNVFGFRIDSRGRPVPVTAGLDKKSSTWAAVRQPRSLWVRAQAVPTTPGRSAACGAARRARSGRETLILKWLSVTLCADRPPHAAARYDSPLFRLMCTRCGCHSQSLLKIYEIFKYSPLATRRDRHHHRHHHYLGGHPSQARALPRGRRISGGGREAAARIPCRFSGRGASRVSGRGCILPEPEPRGRAPESCRGCAGDPSRLCCFDHHTCLPPAAAFLSSLLSPRSTRPLLTRPSSTRPSSTRPSLTRPSSTRRL